MKKFFEKLKKDKFKQAGQGRTLSETSNPKQKTKKEEKPQPRKNPSEGVQRAGAAALARIEADQHKNRNPNWSLSAIRAQAKKELEQESQEKEKEVSRPGPKEVNLEGPKALTVAGVFYNCPLIGPDILPKNEMQSRIRAFLYEQLAVEDEMALSACLIIHTCNQDKTKVKIGIETLMKYLKNIVDNPTEEKYRKIRLENKVFKEKVSSLDGTMDFLLGAGFEKTKIPVTDGVGEEEFLIFPEEKLENLEYLNSLIDALQNAEPITPQLDRNVQVLMPAQALREISLPNEFYNLTIDDIKREQERKAAEAELTSALRTKAMRERDAVRELRRYRYSLIRIRFNDGLILQGTFRVNEPLSEIYEFVSENLLDSDKTFNLLAPGGEKLTELSVSLNELHLIPAALLTLLWDSDATDLRPETMALLQSL